MFNWIFKPKILWTPIDSLLAIIEIVIAIILLNKVSSLIAKFIVKITDYFDSRKR